MANGNDNTYPAKTYVITAAQGIQNPHSAKAFGENPNAGKPNKPLIKNLEDYIENNEAELQICLIPGSYINEIESDYFFHQRDDVYIEENADKRNEKNKEREEEKRLRWEENTNPNKGEMPMHYFWEDIPYGTNYKITGKRLNKNIRLVSVPEPSQNKNPLMGKESLTQKYGGNSIIFPSPKQNLKTVASGQAGEYPKLMMTTGCCTHPNYNTTNRMGHTALRDHQYGFVAVDILDDDIFLSRIVNSQKNGTFIDLGIKYSEGKSPEKAKTIAMVIGDSHVAEINPKVENANREMLRWFQPKYIHYNDIFAAQSINLHEVDDLIDISNKFHEGLTSLEQELILTGKNIKENALIAKEFDGEIVINYSNHDDMLYRWLTKGLYQKDKENMRIAHKILGQGITRHTSFETAIRYLINDLPNNVTFLKPGEDRIYPGYPNPNKRNGYQCAAHGHLGKNGARGSLKSLIEGYGRVIMGHVHTLEKMGDGISVGTSSKIPLPYQLGQPSTSMAGNAVIYSGGPENRGIAQLLPIVKGKWAKPRFNKILNN